jgi:hypothetical protein
VDKPVVGRVVIESTVSWSQSLEKISPSIIRVLLEILVKLPIREPVFDAKEPDASIRENKIAANWVK